MADSPASTTALPGESPAQTKARLRRERLAAKSGASRLQQITALQGGPPRALSELEKDVPGMLLTWSGNFSFWVFPCSRYHLSFVETAHTTSRG
jgi:hypothetical protein